MRIELTLKNYRCFEDTKPARIVLRDGFTAFLGTNNSGKSTLLRFFYEFRNFFEALLNPNTGPNQGMLAHSTFPWGSPSQFPSEVAYPEEVFCNRNARPMEITLKISEAPPPAGPSVDKLIIILARGAPEMAVTAKGYVGESETAPRRPVGGPPQGAGQANWDNMMSALQVVAQVLYFGPFRNAISLLATANLPEIEDIHKRHKRYFDMDVGPALIRQWRMLKTGSSKRAALSALNVANDVRHIFGFGSLSIDSVVNDKNIQFAIDDKEIYTLTELGSGVAQFFVVLANAAAKQPSYILIDEPELNLHPSLQLDFLTTLAKYAKHGIIFATHSIGLARASAEQIYTVHRRQGVSEVIPYERNPRLVELLGELSFSAYREFGFEKVLLVEGATEVRTIQQFLRKYQKDHEILLIPLGGAGLINDSSEAELSELKRISSHIYALIDSEKASSNAPLDRSRQGFVTTCAKIGITCHVLQYRAAENYFTDRAVKQVLGPNFSALGPYDRLRNAAQGWSKSDNWKLAREMTLPEIEGTDLGQFIKGLCS